MGKKRKIFGVDTYWVQSKELRALLDDVAVFGNREPITDAE